MLYHAAVASPHGASHGLIVHVWLVLVPSPQSRHRLRVGQLEDVLAEVDPLDDGGRVPGVLQQVQQELPQVEGRT